MIDIDELKRQIETALPGAVVEVSDPNKDGRHFEACVTAKQFVGKSLVQQHKMVVEPLKELFSSVLHALSLKTSIPKEH